VFGIIDTRPETFCQVRNDLVVGDAEEERTFLLMGNFWLFPQNFEEVIVPDLGTLGNVSEMSRGSLTLAESRFTRHANDEWYDHAPFSSC
jgi:hypothetical protein